MCRWLQVSSSGFYEWRARPVSASQLRRRRLAAAVKHVFDASDCTYGYRRVHAEMARQGTHCSPELVRRLMAEQDLISCQPRPYRVTTEQDGTEPGIADLARRAFTADAPGEVLVGDFTYSVQVAVMCSDARDVQGGLRCRCVGLRIFRAGGGRRGAGRRAGMSVASCRDRRVVAVRPVSLRDRLRGTGGSLPGSRGRATSR